MPWALFIKTPRPQCPPGMQKNYLQDRMLTSWQMGSSDRCSQVCPAFSQTTWSDSPAGDHWCLSTELIMEQWTKVVQNQAQNNTTLLRLRSSGPFLPIRFSHHYPIDVSFLNQWRCYLEDVWCVFQPKPYFPTSQNTKTLQQYRVQSLGWISSTRTYIYKRPSE